MLRAHENPFAADRLFRERYRLDASGWALLSARLRVLQYRGAIVGPHGSGKTTLLEELAQRLAAQGWRTKSMGPTADCFRSGMSLLSRKLAALEPRDLLLLDRAEQLAPLQWWLLRWRARHAGGLIIATPIPGRLPTLWRCRPTPELLRDLSRSLGVPLAANDAAELFTRHAGNLRDALRELHDRHAAHVG